MIASYKHSSTFGNNSRRLTASGICSNCRVLLRGLLAPGYCTATFAAAIILSAATLSGVCHAADEAEPPAEKKEILLYKQDPFDRITLDAANDNKVLKVEPLGLSRGRIDSLLKSQRKLTVHLFDNPEKTFELSWRSIEKVETFEELILKKAEQLTAEKKFDAAYDYHTFLQQNKPKTPGLKEAVEKSLQAETTAAFRAGNTDDALALLRELHRRNPEFHRIDVALGKMTDELVEKYISKKDYVSARLLLNRLAEDYPDHAVVARWTKRLRGEAEPLLAEARAAVEAENWSKAAAMCNRVAELWPQLPGARELARTVQREYPRVVVGVTSLAKDFRPGRLADWNSRRAGRLVYRTLTEFAGPGIEGGSYVCPVGTVSSENLGRKLAVRLKPGIRWAEGHATLTGSDVARRLIEMAEPGSAAYRLDWADLIGAVAPRGVHGLDVELRRAHVRPEAMLQVVLTPYDYVPAQGEPPPTNGPLTVGSQGEEETVFAANPNYFAAEPGRPMALIERRHQSVSRAVRALKRGDIDVIDRLNPWKLNELLDEEDIVVQPYALPLVHCLIPNLRRPLLRDRTFRRALGYGIHRRAILEQMLAGADVPGCEVTSSPFPLSIGPNDPMGYASNESIEPRPYQPRLTIALANVALHNYNDSLPTGRGKLETMPTLVLAHPADEIAGGACASIKVQLELLGIPVELRPIDGPIPDRVPEDVDLLYVELAVWEPVVDARRLLGEDGMSGGCSPYMSQALRRLDEAVEWGEVRYCLHSIHRIAHDEAALIPLWQVVDHFAHNRRVRGIASRPVSLYQNIEQWRPEFKYPEE